jgi:DNA polymerase III epsilon subunit-like protein
MMFDIETLGQKPGCVVTSIGSVKFGFSKGVYDRFKVNISVEDSVRQYGLKVDKNTVAWWETQPKAARDSWLHDPEPIPLKEALEAFVDWLGHDKSRLIWSHGASFDQPIINEAFDVCGMKKPWHYRQEMDTRTVFNMLGYVNSANREQSALTHHDAVADAEAQALALIKLFELEDE